LIDFLNGARFFHLRNNKNPQQTKNMSKRKNEHIDDCVTRLICQIQWPDAYEPPFETLIIDEAHLLKNRVTFWTIGVALIGTHSGRRVPLTGTPYNNGPSDMATIMTFVNEKEPSAKKTWWIRATASSSSSYFVGDVTAWHQKYLLRRLKGDVLKDLPPKLVESTMVLQYKEEIFL
jgi:hypothetical protein